MVIDREHVISRLCRVPVSYYILLEDKDVRWEARGRTILPRVLIGLTLNTELSFYSFILNNLSYIKVVRISFFFFLMQCNVSKIAEGKIAETIDRANKVTI